jgi:hypothetical protein
VPKANNETSMMPYMTFLAGLEAILLAACLILLIRSKNRPKKTVTKITKLTEEMTAKQENELNKIEEKHIKNKKQAIENIRNRRRKIQTSDTRGRGT